MASLYVDVLHSRSVWSTSTGTNTLLPWWPGQAVPRSRSSLCVENGCFIPQAQVQRLGSFKNDEYVYDISFIQKTNVVDRHTATALA